MLASEMSQNDLAKDSVAIEVEILDDTSLISERHKSNLSNNSQEIKSFISTENQEPTKTLVPINPDLEDQSKGNSSDYHMVQKGETLYALSKRYNTSLTQLKIANNLETTLIKAGETLRVRNFEYSDTLSETVWVVSKGDTLYSIAKQNNTTVEDLKNLNDLSSNLIKVGQKLQVNQNSTLSKK